MIDENKGKNNDLINPDHLGFHFNFQEVFDWLKVAQIDMNEADIVSFIVSEVQELADAVESDNKEMKMDGIVDILWAVGNLIAKLDQRGDTRDLLLYARAVSISNFTKFALTEKEAIQTVSFYEQGTHFDKWGQKINCYYEPTNDGRYVIKRTRDHKIMKSYKYKSAESIYKAFTEVLDVPPSGL